MESDKYKLEFERGHDKETGDGYYKLTIKDMNDTVIMSADAHYNRPQPIYMCDIVNIHIKELGKDFPKRTVEVVGVQEAEEE